MDDLHIKRVQSGDRQLARQVFLMLSEVFDEPCTALSASYLDKLLAREDFWVLAACLGSDKDYVVGGITAHALPMTRTESQELFIYDIAVRPEHQRRGIGRRLVACLREAAAQAGIQDVFVPADNDDDHALDFYRSLGAEASPVTLFTFSEATARHDRPSRA